MRMAKNVDRKKRSWGDWVWTLWLAVITIAWAVLLVSILYSRWYAEDMDLGVRVVRLMYEFRTPRELAENQHEVERLLTPEEWERLRLDDTLRVTNTYQKFNYSASEVKVVEWGDGFALYTIDNMSIDPNTLWVFSYTLTPDNLIDQVKEYEVCDVADGRYQD